MLNYYQPDGISYYIRTAIESNVSIRGAFQNPTTTYTASDKWCSESDYNLWDNANKTFYDPCPAGWRVASRLNYRALFKDNSYEQSSTINANVPMNMKNLSTLSADGGAVVYFENNTFGRSTYIRMTGYQDHSTSFILIGGMTNLWCRESNGNRFAFCLSVSKAGITNNAYNISGVWRPRDSHPVRCIQDR